MESSAATLSEAPAAAAVLDAATTWDTDLQWRMPLAKTEKVLALVGAAWHFLSLPGCIRTVSPRLAADATLIGTQRGIAAAFSRKMWEECDEECQLAAVEALACYMPDYCVCSWRSMFGGTMGGFHAAASRGHARVVAVLLAPAWADGVDVGGGESSLAQALVADPALLKTALADKRFKRSDVIEYAFAVAARMGATELLSLLLAARKRRQGGEWHDLSCAAAAGHVEAVRMLLDAGYRPDPKSDADGGRALYSAVAGGHTAIVDLLLCTPGLLRPAHCAYALKASIAQDDLAAFARLHGDPSHVPLDAATLLQAVYIARFPGHVSSGVAFAASRVQHNVHGARAPCRPTCAGSRLLHARSRPGRSNSCGSPGRREPFTGRLRSWACGRGSDNDSHGVGDICGSLCRRTAPSGRTAGDRSR